MACTVPEFMFDETEDARANLDDNNYYCSWTNLRGELVSGPGWSGMHGGVMVSGANYTFVRKC